MSRYFLPLLLFFTWIIRSQQMAPDTIHIKVTMKKQTENYTISEFSIDNDAVTGWFLERGRGTKFEERKAGSEKRIPPGMYEVVHNDCWKYYGPNWKAHRKTCYEEFRLLTRGYTENAGERDKILIHVGNYWWDSKGCILPGSTYHKNQRGEEIKRDIYTGKKDTIVHYTDMVKGSRSKIKKLKEYINTKIGQRKVNISATNGKNREVMPIFITLR
ncbi:MAG: DUF5675 family protein [Bacteroidota bacterium]